MARIKAQPLLITESPLALTLDDDELYWLANGGTVLSFGHRITPLGVYFEGVRRC
jgi:hypothetical protein